MSDNDIDFISKEISNSAIVSSDLKEDLIDHFCCVAEDEMKKRKKIKEAYEKEFRKVFSNKLNPSCTHISANTQT